MIIQVSLLYSRSSESQGIMGRSPVTPSLDPLRFTESSRGPLRFARTPAAPGYEADDNPKKCQAPY